MRIAVAALPLCVIAGPALAAESAADASDQILVTAKREGYRTPDSSTSLKTDTPLLDTPQSVAVIGRQQLDDQAIRSLGDALRYVPGVTLGQGEGNRDQVTLRGQNSTADFYIDGVRDDVQYFRSLYNIDRVEVLKGASALAFGRGGGGGVINRVTKAADLTRTFATLEGGVNSFGGWSLSADANAPLSAKAAARLNAFYEDLATFRDYAGGERYAVNPTVGAEIAPGWQAGLSYEYVHDDRVTDRGIPSLACLQPCTPGPLPGNRDTFFGIPGINRTGIDAHLVTGRLEAELSPELTWSTTLFYGNYDKFYDNILAAGAATAINGTVALSGYRHATQRENAIAQSYLTADARFAGMSHKLLFGLEYGDQQTDNQRDNAVLSSATFNLATRIYPTVTSWVPNRYTTSDVTVFSAYAQDQIGIGEYVDLVAGLRYDSFRITGFDLTDNRAFARTDENVSPRFGVVVKPRPEMSLYASYTKSFLPRSGDQFASLTTANAALAPEEFTNYEVGAKWELYPGFTATAALFQLDRTNATTPDPADPTRTIVVGATRTRGAELGFAGRIMKGWQVSGGSTWQDGHLEGNDAVRLGQVPRNQLALWNRYDVSPTFGVGLGVVHQSSQFAAIRTAPTVTLLPAFTRVDAALFWKPAPALDLQLNVENLTDESYFATANNANNISPGAPLNARLTARVRF